jgi:hypothetical protein
MRRAGPGFRTIAVVGAAALLSSCSPPEIRMVVTRAEGRLEVALAQDWGIIMSDEQIPCVDEIGLYRSQARERAQAVWLIEAEADLQCVDLPVLTVGEVPRGWRQVVPLSAVRGRTYTLTAQGIGSGETQLTF